MKFAYIIIAMFAVVVAAMAPLTVQAQFMLEPPHLEVPGFDEYDCNHCHNLSGSPILECLICHKGTRKSQFDLTNRCLNCHGSEPTIYPATVANTHSSDTSGTERFAYHVECVHCHDPHRHLQDQVYGTSYGKFVEIIISADLEVTDFTVEPPLEIEKHASAIIRFTDETEFDDGDDYYTEDICNTCHSQTNHHQRDGSAPGGQGHFDGTDCTSCHLHINGFGAPAGGGACTACHAEEQGARRQVVGAGGDFGKMSHHVRGEVQDEDCMACHYVGDHASQTVKLKDADLGDVQVYSYDPAAPAGLEAFCLSCHDADGAAGDVAPFSDEQEVPDIEQGGAWTMSAHATGGTTSSGYTCFGDGATTGCHANAHGSDNERLLSREDVAVSIDQFCFNCHTEGVITNNAISGAGLADDIEQAFSFDPANQHDLAAAFSVEGNSFTLHCTSCHNPHVVTGKYWEADLDLSPVTRPDFSDPVNNPRAMGSILWGDVAGEKIDDFAGSGGGTFRTPEGDAFSGSELPDYVTFCLDCHGVDRMPDPAAGGAGGISWGVDEAHGTMSANNPSGYGVCPNWLGCGKGENWDLDNCVADDGGGSDADCWPVLQSGRGDQIFTRSSYDHEERVGGANFTLSCTDCHEAHGSDAYSFLRSVVNDRPGSGVQGWPDSPSFTNDICDSCHYYYSDWHAGFSQWGSCVASYGGCHVPDTPRSAPRGSIHGMWGSGSTGGTRTFDQDLVLEYTFSGNLKDSGDWQMDGIWSLHRHNPGTGYDCQDVGDPYPCCTGPGTGTCVSECVGVEDPYPCCTDVERGTCNDTDAKRVCEWVDDPTKVGSYVPGRFGNAIEINDQPIEVGTENCLWSTDAGYHGTWKFTEMKYNMTLEAWVYPTVDDGERKILAKHTYWSGGYALVLKQINGRLRAGLLTNINGGGGSDCDGLRGAFSTVTIPLDEWTHVAATYDHTGPDRDDNDGSVGRIRIYVNGEDVTDSYDNDALCYTQPGSGEDAMFPHSDWNDIDPSNCYEGHWCASALSIGGVNWSDSNNNFIGRLDEVKVWNITKDSTYFELADSQAGPYISRVEGAVGSTELFVTFSEEVFGSGAGDELIPSDFILSCPGKTITDVQHTAGEATAILTLDTPLAAEDIGTCTVAAGTIYDEYSTAAITTAATIEETLYLPCPTSPVTIDLNEAPGSAIVQDSQLKLKGQVGGASTLTGNEFWGDGGTGNPDTTGESNYVYFGNNLGCMQATTAMTIETRIKPTGITSEDSIRRILDKEGGSGYELQVWRNTSKPERYPNFDPPDNVATIALWTIPADSHGGDSWKVMLSDYTTCPIVSDHWYQVKVVWDTNKPGGTPGQPFVPGEIYIDDQGTDGVSEPAAGAGENWSGYIDCTHADQYYLDDIKKLYTGDEMTAGDGDFAIGANTTKLLKGGNHFNGLIDWIEWQPVADYSGVDDPID